MMISSHYLSVHLSVTLPFTEDLKQMVVKIKGKVWMEKKMNKNTG
jgi:hypothetical protein